MEDKIIGMTGIYQIQSIIKSERIYVGSAIDIEKRWKEHKRDLRANRHKSPKLQRHFNKYGELDFIYSVLIYCEKDKLIYTEQINIDLLNPYFNTNKIANSPLGLKRSQKTKNKISKANTGKWGNRKGVKSLNTSVIKGKVTRLINRVNKCIDNGIMYHSQKEKRIMKANLRIKKIRDKIEYDKNNPKVRNRCKQNKIKSHLFSSTYRGVCIGNRKYKNETFKMIRAIICYDSKIIHLGCFKTEIDAAVAFNKKAIELYGDNAALNIII